MTTYQWVFGRLYFHCVIECWILDKIRLVFLSYSNIEMQDMGIEDSEIVELVNEIEELERKLYAHPLHKVYPSF